MKKLALAVAAFPAVIVALWLVLYAAFPYFYAESGSARYAREHRGEAMLQLLAAAVLLWIAWYCIRHSLSSRIWLAIGGVLVAAAVVKGVADHRRPPDGAKLIGGNWYVVVEHRPAEIDTVIYGLYYKHAGSYHSVDIS